jgi:hypothetical protein
LAAREGLAVVSVVADVGTLEETGASSSTVEWSSLRALSM